MSKRAYFGFVLFIVVLMTGFSCLGPSDDTSCAPYQPTPMHVATEWHPPLACN